MTLRQNQAKHFEINLVISAENKSLPWGDNLSFILVEKMKMKINIKEREGRGFVL